MAAMTSWLATIFFNSETQEDTKSGYYYSYGLLPCPETHWMTFLTVLTVVFHSS